MGTGLSSSVTVLGEAVVDEFVWSRCLAGLLLRGGCLVYAGFFGLYLENDSVYAWCSPLEFLACVFDGEFVDVFLGLGL